MRLMILSIFIFFFACDYLHSQVSVVDSVKEEQDNKLFLKGIYLDNFDVLIPWGESYYNLSKYGNSRIIRTSIFRQVLSWDSIQIIEGAVVNLFCNNYKRSDKKFFSVYAQIKTADYTRLKQLFIRYTGSEGMFRAAKKKKGGHYAYYWTINGCGVLLGDMGKQHYYLRIEKIDKS